MTHQAAPELSDVDVAAAAADGTDDGDDAAADVAVGTRALRQYRAGLWGDSVGTRVVGGVEW